MSEADGLPERQLSTFLPTPTMALMGAGKFTLVVPKFKSKSVRVCLGAAISVTGNQNFYLWKILSPTKKKKYTKKIKLTKEGV